MRQNFVNGVSILGVALAVSGTISTQPYAFLGYVGAVVAIFLTIMGLKEAITFKK